LIDQRHQWKIEPDKENQMLANGFDLPVSPYDDTQEHIQSHEQAAHETGDPNGTFRRHIMEHIKAVQAQIQMQQGQPGGNQGAPGGAGPGIAGTPRPGAMPAPQRNSQQPAGAVHADQMADGGAGMRG